MRQLDISFLRRRLAEIERDFSDRRRFDWIFGKRRPTGTSNSDLMRGKISVNGKRNFFSQRVALSDKFSNAGSERGVLSQLITVFYRRTRYRYTENRHEALVRLINCTPYLYSRE